MEFPQRQRKANKSSRTQIVNLKFYSARENIFHLSMKRESYGRDIWRMINGEWASLEWRKTTTIMTVNAVVIFTMPLSRHIPQASHITSLSLNFHI